MKKLLAILVVLTMVVGAVSAVDLSGTVFGHVNLFQGDNVKDSKVGAGGGMDRMRIDGSGTAADGVFGGYIRVQGSDIGVETANAWWKPIDQFKFIIGNNGDGQWGKEGVTGWSFNQMPNDSGIATNYGIWFGDGWGSSLYGNIPAMHNRYTFFEGMNEYGVMMEITPIDMFGVNIGIPFIDQAGEAKEVYGSLIGQLNVNLDFGNIAITYDGGGRAVRQGNSDGAIFAYFGGTFGDLGIDFGFAFHLKGDGPNSEPIGIGLGVKYAAGAFGIKVRATLAMAGDDEVTYVNASILPYYAFSDNVSLFLNAGLGIMAPKDGDSIVGFYANPYLRVGAEWGPTFYVGANIEASGAKGGGDDGTGKLIKFSVPVSLMVSF